MNYYNENDAEKAACLREFITANLIAPGEVDERSIEQVQSNDLRGFSQCHFFAGFGIWSYALRLAGWPDDRPVWTGSCPCPSFSAAGKGKGFDDPRHLWPAWERLISIGRPPTLFGEQADDAIGYGWLDLVQTDLERAHYATGKAVLTAAGLGAPHCRERLYFMAHAQITEIFPRPGEVQTGAGTHHANRLRDGDAVVGMDHADSKRRRKAGSSSRRSGAGGLRPSNDVANADSGGQPMRWLAQAQHDGEQRSRTDGFWRDADWVLRKRWNREGWEWCPTQPGVFPLATGVANRVLKLRGYGDAIIPQVAAAFIIAANEALRELCI